MAKAMTCLTNPSPGARVGTRWWWYGLAVTRREVDRQLREMARAGLGMAEIQIIYEAQEDDPALDQRHVDYFSPEFFEILDYTLEAARQYGIQLDFTLGSGWPFGGSFVLDTMAPAILVPYQHDVMGPCTFEFDYTCVLNGEIERVVLCPIRDGVMDWRAARDVTGCVEPTYIYTWQWGSRLSGVEVPEGPHKIYTFVVQKYKQNIGKPAPNMHGLAIDHCRRDVVDTYMATMGQTLIDKLGRGRFRGFFCDSIELGGNNWAVNLIEEFKKRRGYDLTPYLPALWGDMGDITPLVRGDYFATFGELAQENFFENFACWCRKLGVQSRIQAHGIWSDILKAYAAADVPEGETFGDHDCYFVNTIHRRLAVSAGLVYGRPVVSNESFTWLRTPRYLVTPEMIKRAADAIFVDGINQIVNHGFSYSPEWAGKPGWNFYASSMINMNNTWWDYYPPLCAYMHRICALMQAGEIVSPVAVYLPQDDVRAHSTIAELHMALRLEDRIGRECVNRLQRAGYWFTFVNDEALEKLLPERFKAVVLVNVERVSVAAARALRCMDQAGVAIVSVGAPPEETCGLMNYAQNREKVRALMAGLKNLRLASDSGAALIEALNRVCEPDLVVEGEDARDVGFIHRRIDGQEVYFVANIAAKARLCKMSVPSSAPVRVFDPMRMADVAPVSAYVQDGRTHMRLNLAQNQSLVLFVGEEGLPARELEKEPESIAVNGWTLRVEGREIASGLSDPVGWEQFADARYFSGEGEYSAQFEWTGEEKGEAVLSLEGVKCCCTVLVNGEEQARLWMAPYRARLTNLRRGVNQLTVRVVNTWINHVIAPEAEPVYSAQKVTGQWPYFTAIVDDIHRRRFFPVREREMVKSPEPSGLTGPVRLLIDRR